MTVQGPDGERRVEAGELFVDYLTTSLAPGELVTAVHVPDLDGFGHGYEKFTRRAEDWAMVGVCALVKRGGRRVVRGRPRGPDEHGPDAAARPRGGGRAARRRRSTPGRSPARPSTRPRAPTRRATSTRRRTSRRTWRGC